MMTGFGLIGLVFMLLFWGGLILLAIWFVRTLFPSTTPANRSETSPGGQSSSAKEILDRRYARGEITREQYETMKRDLT